MPEFLSGLPTRIEGYRRRAEDARSKAENTRFGKTKASWLQLARLWDELADQLQPLAPTAETDAPQEAPQPSASEKLTETRMIRARTGLLFLLADSHKAGAGWQAAVRPPKARPPGASHNNAEPRRLTLAGGAFS
jgi:hypothetical protein